MSPSLHSLNRGFRWIDRSGPFRRLASEQVQSFDERGFLVLEDAFDRATIDAVTAVIDPVEAEVTAFLETRPEGRLFIADASAITFTPHLVARSARLRAFCAGPVFQDLAHDLVGPDVRLYWDQAVYKKPAPGREFPWHQDNGYTYIEPQQYLTCWVALGDTTRDNGCPWVVPGLHRQGTLRHQLTDVGWQCLEEPIGALPIPLRAGSIAVFSSLTPHRTGPNISDAVRKAYIVQFAPDGARCLRDSGDGTGVPQDDPGRQFPVLRAGRAPDSGRA
jgi:ectoine hydroxylase-related dioxygenase (phytanoyl-CoA dioxygenase family)